MEIEPAAQGDTRFLQLLGRGRVVRKEVYSLYAKHNARVAKEQARNLLDELEWNEVNIYMDEWLSDCAGMALVVVIHGESVTECFTSIAHPNQVCLPRSLITIHK